MLKIAITGGIASGKSTVAKILKSYGYVVYSADEIYSELLNDRAVIEKISLLVGVEPILKDGKLTLDRKAVARKVFNDKNLLKEFNDYTHGLVYDKIDDIVNKSREKILFFEIPLLFESQKHEDYDQVIVVKRDLNERILSATKRSGLTENEVINRIKNQIDYDNFDFTKHTVIYNDGTLNDLEGEVEGILKKII